MEFEEFRKRDLRGNSAGELTHFGRPLRPVLTH